MIAFTTRAFRAEARLCGRCLPTESGWLVPPVKRAVSEGLFRAGFGETLKGWFVRESD